MRPTLFWLMLVGASIAGVQLEPPAKADIKALDDDVVYKVGGKVVAPQPKFKPAPRFPPGYHTAHATVIVRAIVGKDGFTRDIHVERSTAWEFNNMAIATVRKWIFDPATKAGTPVSARISIELRFDGSQESDALDWEQDLCFRMLVQEWTSADSPAVRDFRYGCTALDYGQKRAAEYFQSAANSGLLPAQLMMAGLHRDGRGVRKDKIEALKWIAIAQANGNTEAAAQRRNFEAKLKAEEIAQAEALAKEWRSGHQSTTAPQ